jgi:hypothetical protein
MENWSLRDISFKLPDTPSLIQQALSAAEIIHI